MEYIYYSIKNRVNKGTEDEPLWEDSFVRVRIGNTEANLALVKKEAYNGEYTIEDDGVPEPTPEPTTEERIAVLEEENAMLMECILEMSEIVYA